MKRIAISLTFLILACLAVVAEEPQVDSERVIAQARSAATARSAYNALYKSAAIEETTKALAEERKKNPPDQQRISELAAKLSDGLRHVADAAQPVADQLDSLRDQFQDAADALRAQAERGTGDTKTLGQRLAAPYEEKLKTLAENIDRAPSNSPQRQRLLNDFAFNLSMRNAARGQGATSRPDGSMKTLELAKKYDFAAGAVLIRKRQVLVQAMGLDTAAMQLDALVAMTKAAQALDSAQDQTAELDKAMDTSLREVDTATRDVDRVLDRVMEKINTNSAGPTDFAAPNQEEIEKELQEYLHPTKHEVTYHYDRSGR